jgi:hypothetical protein
MGKTRGPYKAEFPVGSLVKITGREALESFLLTWKLHNKLQPEQVDHADKIGKVKSVSFYHGGDELYEIEGIPGIWHEQCLEVAPCDLCR